MYKITFEVEGGCLLAKLHKGSEDNWSLLASNPVHDGDTDGAVVVLESQMLGLGLVIDDILYNDEGVRQ